MNPLMYFLNKPSEEVQSVKPLGFTIIHNLSWANHIAEFVSKANCRLGIFHYAQAKVFPQQIQTSNKVCAFICSSVSFPLWVGAPA